MSPERDYCVFTRLDVPVYIGTDEGEEAEDMMRQWRVSDLLAHFEAIKDAEDDPLLFESPNFAPLFLTVYEENEDGRQPPRIVGGEETGPDDAPIGCAACKGRGFLLSQCDGKPYLEVQRCDACETFETDLDAGVHLTVLLDRRHE